MKKADKVILSSAICDGVLEEVFSGGIAIKDDKIVFIGSEEEVKNYYDESTIIYDMEDNFVLPGFIDPHSHNDITAFSLANRQCTDLFNAKSADECVAMMKKYRESNPSYTRLVAMGWDIDMWDDSNVKLSKHLLDEHFPDIPVYLFDGCFHTLWCNTKALEESEITKDSTVSFGRIGREENGEPNGVLYETEAYAKSLLLAYSLDDPEEFEQIYREFFEGAAKFGLTSLCTLSAMVACPFESLPEYDVSCALEDKGQLPVRVYAFPSMGTKVDPAFWARLKEKYTKNRFKVSGLKSFVDGIIHQQTAYFKEPYDSNPETCGEPFLSKELFTELVTGANKEGYPVRLHCIGDAATVLGVEVYKASLEANKDFKKYNVIEHVNCMDMDDIPLLQSIPLVISTQPTHLLTNLPAYIANAGAKRANRAYPVGNILRAGVITAIGSDAPCASMDPLLNIHGAVTRKYEGKVIGRNPDECVTVFEAIRAHTYNAACSANAQDTIGTLEVGKYADITILDKNLLAIDPDEIPSAQVVMTMCGGEVSYSV